MIGLLPHESNNVVDDDQVFGGGITRTVTGEFSAEIKASPRPLLRFASSTMPSVARPAQISARDVEVVLADAAVKTSMSSPPNSAT